MKTATLAERAFWDSSGLVLLCANQKSTAVACHEHPRNRAFICFDAKLASAANAAGFAVLPAT